MTDAQRRRFVEELDRDLRFWALVIVLSNAAGTAALFYLFGI